MIQLSELLIRFEEAWPSSHAEDWDRVGLSVGSKHLEINKILVAVDLTEEVANEAINLGANLILTHHPFLLKPIGEVTEEQLKGQLVAKLIRNSMALFSAHTNADVQADGASTLMAKAFGLTEYKPIIKTAGGFGHGVIGTLAKPIRLEDFAKVVANELPRTARKIVFAGRPDELIQKVAICSGAGDSFLPQVLASDADVFVTSDLRHHPALDAISSPREKGPLALIDVSHWASESLWTKQAAELLNQIEGVEVFTSEANTDPWTQEVN